MSVTEEGQEGEIDQRPTSAFPDSATWVSLWLCPNLEREIKRTFEGCPSWWDHPEAVQRIEALWRAWESLRLDGGTGMNTWWVDHADPQLAQLCNPDIGPFGHCHTTHGRDIAPLLALNPPDDWPLRPGPAVNPSPTTVPTTREEKA